MMTVREAQLLSKEMERLTNQMQADFQKFMLNMPEEEIKEESHLIKASLLRELFQLDPDQIKGLIRVLDDFLNHPEEYVRSDKNGK